MPPAGEAEPPPPLDPTRPSHARVYALLAGGKDHYAADRTVYDQIAQFAPELPQIIREQRQWLIRVVQFLAGRAGIDQFLDLGSGLPSAENTHEAAQRVNPDAVVVYVDNDPMVIAHGQALLEDNDRTHFVAADITLPDALLTHHTVVKYLDFSRPIALLQSGIIHLVADSARPREVVAAYVEALAPGSYLALSHLCTPPAGSEYFELAGRVEETLRRLVVSSLTFRTRPDIMAFFGGLDLVDPGLTMLHEWWPTGPRLDPVSAEAHLALGGVARKP
jgi:SAM-dependent methyltransferase